MELIVKSIESRYSFRTTSTPCKWIAILDGKEVAYADTEKDAKAWGEAQRDILQTKVVDRLRGIG